MLRNKLESESEESVSGPEIADSEFLLFYVKPPDSEFGLPSLTYSMILFSSCNLCYFLILIFIV